MSQEGFERKLEALDISLFDSIETQSSSEDRLSWLAVQRAVRRRSRGYTYLEIGSHLGGSIQQHLPDPRCKAIFSIDKRPPQQADDRGHAYDYPDNSTDRMLAELARVPGGDIAKVRCFDMDASEIPLDAISKDVDFCF